MSLPSDTEDDENSGGIDIGHGEQPASPSDPEDSQDIEALFEKLSSEEGMRLLAVAQKRSIFSGPLPPPEVLREYGDVVPGLAEKIVEMAGKEQEHRHKLEDKDLTLDRQEAMRGQYLGAATMLSFVLAAIIVTLQGYWEVGIALVAAPLFQQIRKLFEKNTDSSAQE